MGRFNVEFSDEAEQVLEALAKRGDCTKAEVLRRAINLEKWFWDTTDAGGKVVAHYADGRIIEIVRL